MMPIRRHPSRSLVHAVACGVGVGLWICVLSGCSEQPDITPLPADPSRPTITTAADLPRQLPLPNQRQSTAGPHGSLLDPIDKEDMELPEDEWVPPSEIASKAFGPPPGTKQLSQSNVWVDVASSRVYADGYVAVNDRLLEMFACPVGTKEHETIVATLAQASDLHTGLLTVGAKPGAPVRFIPDFVPASGQRIRVWICYRDEAGKFQAVDARKWVRYDQDELKLLEEDWVFAGSSVWQDPDNGENYYQANAGDMICVSNFSSAMLDIPVASSADADGLTFAPHAEIIPKVGTPIRMVLCPMSDSDDSPAPHDVPPKESILPENKETETVP